jgi:hypothetical protein
MLCRAPPFAHRVVVGDVWLDCNDVPPAGSNFVGAVSASPRSHNHRLDATGTSRPIATRSVQPGICPSMTLPIRAYVAEVHANPKPDPPLFGHIGLAFGHPTLDFHSAANSLHHTRKFRQQAVAGVLYDPATVLPDLGVDQLPEMRLLGGGVRRCRAAFLYGAQLSRAGTLGKLCKSHLQ